MRRGAVGVERAKEQIAETLERIGRVKDLLAQLGQHDERLPLGESCAEALAEDTDADPEVNRTRAELEAAMSAVEGLIRKTFLAEAKSSSARRQERSMSFVRTSLILPASIRPGGCWELRPGE